MTKQIEVRVPDLGEAKAAFVGKVLVSLGQAVARDALVVLLETDKVAVEVRAHTAGRVAEIPVALNASVGLDDLLLVLEPSEPAPPSSALKEPSPASANGGAHFQPVVAPATTSGEFHASPWIRGLARERGLKLSDVVGTGRHGRILEGDLGSAPPLSHAHGADVPLRNDSALPEPGATETRLLSRLQCAVGRNLVRNWTQIPHVTQFDETDITELEAFRIALNQERHEEGLKLSLLPFIIKATACALATFPEFNSSLVGENLILKRDRHIGFAVDTSDGLRVPVIQHAERLTLPQLAREIARLAERARTSALTSSDSEGGTFTISNLGGAGGTAFTPIINAPEVAILGVSKAELKPKWNGSAFVPRLMLPLSISYDHRVINGVAGARFVSHLGSLLTDLRRTLL